MGTLRASKIFSDSSVTLIGLESVDCRYTESHAFYQLYGNIKLIAVIIRVADGTYAVDSEIKPVAIDQLRQNIPDLDAIIAPFL